tara:strand:- start:390 stop:656 length:267 start_codon:yes stop_codon:yes gene_type:complete
MSSLPPSSTPLNQHSLITLELWLEQLGAKKSINNPSLWNLETTKWVAELTLDREELCVIWNYGSSSNKRCFSYRLSREDVEAAISEGP